MKLTTNDLFASYPSFHCPCHSSPLRRRRFHGLHLPINITRKSNSLSVAALSDSDLPSRTAFSRRAILLAPPLLTAAASLFLKPSLSLASEESSSATVTPPTESAAPPAPATPTAPSPPKEETITSRIYDATAIGEPMAIGKDKNKVWEKLMNARVVYLGEAEQVPTKDDKELELQIVRNLRKRCVESERQISVALEAFPLDLQDQLNQYMDKRCSSFVVSSFILNVQ